MKGFQKLKNEGKKKEDKSLLILNAAETLFLQNGYRKTSMREIISLCGTSLGLISYYYKSKYELAKSCLQRHFQIIENAVSSSVDFNTDALLYHATYLRFANRYFMQPFIYNFYYECLEEGIYSDYIFGTVPRTLREINAQYKTGYSDDYILLYGNYLPAELEKILIVQKRKGLFSQISDEDIPTIIFETAVSRFTPDKSLIWDATHKSMMICDELAAKMIIPLNKF